LESTKLVKEKGKEKEKESSLPPITASGLGLSFGSQDEELFPTKESVPLVPVTEASQDLLDSD